MTAETNPTPYSPDQLAHMAKITGHYTINKFNDDAHYQDWLANPHHPELNPDGVKPFETLEGDNLFITAGIGHFMDLASGILSSGTGGNNPYGAACQIGVGNGTTAAAATDTDLSGTSKFYQTVSGAPTRTTNNLAFTAVYASGNANFVWGELMLFANTTQANPLSHIVGTYGTKVAGQVWTATYTLTIA